MNYSILVCDDSTVARKQVVRSLSSSLNANIKQAKDGLEAIELLKSHAIDLLCLDLTMPQLDGIGVLEYIKNDPQIETFVVVISADIQATMKQKVIQLGAIEFLEKPVDSEHLLKLLHTYGIR
ncbi:Chemotaxis protein CheY [Pseudoalteromonas holothuriae]|uniref:Chemotaxis protein CheY n=1 Tax=Pseudoalteromonas holothuriae TaxID=2963714 RepID=A0A9W4QQP9_9GAMM|nr:MULTISPECIES: response regulator [unclassified Pseudoalteromonas]CAH9049474.1 Chemotaxis protein CheY [Pseudoalteromonas sp. CIP111854]CAH9055781.1 Chemotaxis protein CheY [Pseudoalteromonas sp. CIP111951]